MYIRILYPISLNSSPYIPWLQWLSAKVLWVHERRLQYHTPHQWKCSHVCRHRHLKITACPSCQQRETRRNWFRKWWYKSRRSQNTSESSESVMAIFTEVHRQNHRQWGNGEIRPRASSASDSRENSIGATHIKWQWSNAMECEVDKFA